MGPQQSSSPVLPLVFQSRLLLRCVPFLRVWRNVGHVFAAAGETLTSPKTLRRGVPFI